MSRKFDSPFIKNYHSEMFKLFYELNSGTGGTSQRQFGILRFSLSLSRHAATLLAGKQVNRYLEKVDGCLTGACTCCDAYYIGEIS